MAYVVGIDFGSTKTTVATAPAALVADSATVVAELASAVFAGDGGVVLFGDRAEELGEAAPHRILRDVKRRLGDSVPLMTDGWSAQAESVVAAVIRQVVNDLIDREGSAPEAIAITVPAGWGSFKQALLAGALEREGLVDIHLISEPAAAVVSSMDNQSPHSTVVVYDLGGDSFQAAVLSRTGAGDFAILGAPQQLDGVAGGDFDQLVFSHVQKSANLGAQDIGDPTVIHAMRDLRLACRTAKEALSLDTETTIPVSTPQVRTRIRLVRAEFDDLIRDAIEDTLEATRRCVTSAGLTVRDVDAIVLVGGSANIPLVAQMISAEFELPIVIGAQPGAAISMGAAQSAALARQPEPGVSPALSLVPPAVPPPTQDGPTGAPSAAAPAEAAGAQVRAALGADVAGRAAPEDAPPLSPVLAAALQAGRIEQTGRHRQPGRRRYWLRTTGIVASVAGVLLLGSSIAVSKAAETVPPDTGSQEQGRDDGTMGPGPIDSSRGSGPSAALVTAPESTPPEVGTPPPVSSSGVSEPSPASTAGWMVPDTGPAPVDAPAVVVALAGSVAGDASSSSEGSRATR